MLARRGFSPAEAQEIAAAVLALLVNPDFAPFLSSSSLAEVPFAADLGEPLGPVSGQIDRLVVTEEEIFILDFKTDREPPARDADINPAYIAQLAAYRAGLARIFPGKGIRAALLWTAAPRLMEVPAPRLEEAFSAYHNPVRRP
jgi:ATP-dependent helicase/nuclease subunit A